MENKVCIVVGGSSGIGEATAKKLLAMGVSVYSFARRECKVDGVKSVLVDVTDRDSLNKEIAKVSETEGKIDFLVNSAGFSMSAPFEYIEEQDAKYLFEVDYFAVARAIAAVLPDMRKRGSGRIVNIGSVGGVLAIPYDAYYSSAKAALNMLAKELNLELAPLGITVTNVLPGGTATPFTFARKLYDTRKVDEYRTDNDNAAKTLADTEQNGDTAEKVADLVIKELYSLYPRTVVAVGLVNKAYYLLSKLLPEKMLNALLRVKYSLKKAEEKG